MFFKENVIHKVYGSKPSNYQITNVAGRGIASGSYKSAVIVNEVLYYLSKNGVCQYGGGTPSGIYSPFGNEKYSDGVAGKAGDKYYISMKNRKGKYSLFCFDENLNMWFKEDDTRVKFFAEDKGNLYFIDGNNDLWVADADNYDEEYAHIAKREGNFEWFAETGDIGDLSCHLLIVGIVEEQHQVELVVGDAGADLLAAAVGIGQEAVYVQTGGIGYHVTGGVGGVDVVLGQNTGISGAELYHQLFLVIVGHKGDIHGSGSFLFYLIRSRGAFSPRIRFAMFR